MKHCTHCGGLLNPVTDGKAHPDCQACGAIHFRNPIQVAVLMQPIRTPHGLRLLVGRRGIAPFIDELAFSGGFVEIGEDSRKAALREFSEESGTEGLINLDTLVLVGERSTPDGMRNLMFVHNIKPLEYTDLDLLKNTAEMHDWKPLEEGDKLCFSLHQEFAWYWNEAHSGRYDPGPYWAVR